MILNPIGLKDHRKSILTNILLHDNEFSSKIADKIRILAKDDSSKVDNFSNGLLVDCHITYNNERIEPQIVEDYFLSILDRMENYYKDMYSDAEKEIQKRSDQVVKDKMCELVDSKTSILIEQLKELTNKIEIIKFQYSFDDFEI